MKGWLLWFALLGAGVGAGAAADAPDVMRLSTWEPGGGCPPGWLISEKLDGVRAIWDGRVLRSRGGTAFAAPDWFTVGLPPFALDGELWSGRGEFQRIASIVTRETPHEGWRAIGYHVFEVPDAAGGLRDRLAVLDRWLATHPRSHLHRIPQTPCRDAAHLKAVWDEVEGLGGEGLVLRDPDAPVLHGRDARALKLKRFQDMEAVVVGYRPGKGRLAGLLGALECALPDGTRFAIGSGFSDAERADPPPPGSTVTFRYQGLTEAGVPRFPVFLRVRPPGS